MTPYFLLRALRLGLFALSTLLVSCGSSTITDPFKPTRVIVFGDSFSFISTTVAYTVNDSSTNNWASQIAASYGVTNVVNRAAANALVATVQTQVNTFGANYQSGDLVIVSAGYRDIINDAVGSTNNATANGTAYANLIRSMVTNGAKHIAASGVYDLSKTPAAGIQTNLATLTGSRGALIAAFNDALKSNLGSATLTNVGEYVRLLDLEAYFNTVRASPTTYSFVDTTTVACNSNGATVGIGAGQIDSSVCGTGTLAQAAYNSYVFADAVYPTPAFHRAWGSNAYAQLIARW
jgi:outer membrane lipase/esterase